MIANFPKGYQCPSEHRARWPELERTMLPLIKAKARRIKKFTGGVDMDDAIQEGRLALLAALAKHDPNKGPLDRYVSVCLNNAYNGLLYKMLSVTRMPRAVVRAPNGEQMSVPYPPLLLGNMDMAVSDEYFTPEIECQHTEMEEQARIFKLKLLNNLKGRDRDVFECRTNPSVDFLKMVQNVNGNIYAPTIQHIAQYLGVSKNSVDWSLYKIKESFTQMARGDEFSELFGDVVRSKEWPMIHVSDKIDSHDVEFVAKIIRKRKLDPKPVEGYERESDFHQKAGAFSRMIERYPWGVVLVLRRQALCHTLVIECDKFTPLTGDVFGAAGTHELVPVKWYSQLVKALKAQGRKKS